MTKDKLIKLWESELDLIESNLLKSINENNNGEIEFQSGKKIRLTLCISELKNLPNEPKTVSNNESKVKNFRCPFCAKEFEYTHDLNNHINFLCKKNSALDGR